uniref:UPF0481 protein At3g47200 family n=1 Tax=Cajanus cajan TaxID=3821 RepID=A0A151QXW7_CAJCA|nr:UPF0481 protein At3g47200 family [Cajanus cajan]
MEETKWRYMREFLDRKGPHEQQNRRSEQRLRECGTDILKLEKLIIASYGGNIESEPQELSKIMIVDGCFLLELLIRLKDFINGNGDTNNNNTTITNTNSNNNNNTNNYSNDPILKNEEKMVAVLNDITKLENQIPFIVLKKLYRKVFPDGSNIDDDHRVANIVREAFGYNGVDNSGGVHILHLMHLSTVEQNQQEGKLAKQELLRCATRLVAAGIAIEGGSTRNRHRLVDWFNFEISFDGEVLRIPQLYVKETTEVRWRNLIAWEQSKIWIRCKYTSYALFFKGLVCCKHDVELLKEKGVIVNEAGKSNEELLNLFRTISNGAEYMDSSYGVCETIVYYWWNWYKILIRDHIPTVWKFIGVLAAVALLVLTFIQAYYAVHPNK